MCSQAGELLFCNNLHTAKKSGRLWAIRFVFNAFHIKINTILRGKRGRGKGALGIRYHAGDLLSGDLFLSGNLDSDSFLTGQSHFSRVYSCDPRIIWQFSDLREKMKWKGVEEEKDSSVFTTHRGSLLILHTKGPRPQTPMVCGGLCARGELLSNKQTASQNS